MDEIIRAVLEEIERKVKENVSEDQEVETTLLSDDKSRLSLMIELPDYRSLPALQLGSEGKAATLIMNAVEEEVEEERRYSYTVTNRHLIKRYDLCNPSSIDEVIKDVINYVNTGILPKRSKK